VSLPQERSTAELVFEDVVTVWHLLGVTLASPTYLRSAVALGVLLVHCISFESTFLLLLPPPPPPE